MDKVLSVSGLSVNFGEQSVIRGLDFELMKGESLAIIGPNGSGKTVLLRVLLDSVNYAGEIKWTPGIRLGYVPQKIEADRHLPITIKNLLAAKARVLKLSDAEAKWAAEAAGLTAKIIETPVGHLSGGQFQRALIAFALLGRPDVLLLDEPTSSIDIPGEIQVYELIHELQDKYGITILLVSHDLSFVYKYATKVLCLNKTGLCYGPPEEALNTATLEKLYGPHRYFHHFHDKDRHHDA